MLKNFGVTDPKPKNFGAFESKAQNFVLTDHKSQNSHVGFQSPVVRHYDVSFSVGQSMGLLLALTYKEAGTVSSPITA